MTNRRSTRTKGDVIMARDDKAGSGSESKLRPYPPSWVDRFTDWVARLPGPPSLVYLGIGLLLLVVQAVALWMEEAYSIGTLPPLSLFFAAVMPFFLAQFRLLDDTASAALATLQPILEVGEEEYSELHYRLTVLPAWPTLLAGLAMLITSILLDVFWANPVHPDAISTALVYSVYKIVWWTFGTLAYHAVHQLRWINRILTVHTRINLFQMGPVYAFSKLAALTAAGLAIPTYGYFIGGSGALLDPIVLVQLLLILALAIVVFVWPLLGIHRLLGEEKERLLNECSLRFEAGILDLHRRMDEGKLEGMSELNSALASLEIEQNALNGISTWPWEPETVRLLITALALPLGLWIVQFVLERVLGA
jgi:hypothetical protein